MKSMKSVPKKMAQQEPVPKKKTTKKAKKSTKGAATQGARLTSHLSQVFMQSPETRLTSHLSEIRPDPNRSKSARAKAKKEPPVTPEKEPVTPKKGPKRNRNGETGNNSETESAYDPTYEGRSGDTYPSRR
jgi:hypothetical protein